MTCVLPLGTGRMSTFGGPDDDGVGPLEGLALVGLQDYTDPWFRHLFLPPRPHVGAARTLDPRAFYLAMRWAYGDGDGRGPGEILPGVPASVIRRARFIVTARNRACIAQAVDWGPHRLTGRLADLSPGVASTLSLSTDDPVTIEAILPDRYEAPEAYRLAQPIGSKGEIAGAPGVPLSGDIAAPGGKEAS